MSGGGNTLPLFYREEKRLSNLPRGLQQADSQPRRQNLNPSSINTLRSVVPSCSGFARQYIHPSVSQYTDPFHMSIRTMWRLWPVGFYQRLRVHLTLSCSGDVCSWSFSFAFSIRAQCASNPTSPSNCPCSYSLHFAILVPRLSFELMAKNSKSE